MATVTEKKCAVCKMVKPRSEFHRDRRHKTGLQSRCVPCHKESMQNSLDKARAQQTPSCYPCDDAGVDQQEHR